MVLKIDISLLIRCFGIFCVAFFLCSCAHTLDEDRAQAITEQDMDLSTKEIFVLESGKCTAHIPTSAKLSFVGDNVLGDYKGSSGQTFNAKFAEVNEDFAYFSAGVREVLLSDDLTIGNMEGVLSDKNLKNAFEKPFSFKGTSRYTEILKIAGFEALNVANNHSRDYGAQGFQDTIEHLSNAGLAVFGEGIIHLYEVNGIRFGLAGHRGWNLGIKSQVKKEIDLLRSKGADIVIFTFHWGEERMHYPNAAQRELAHFTIDSGADMVIGHHPHVLQGIEEYKGKKIVYSLGNFIYGGAKNPSDKDTMIYQTHFIKLDSRQDRKEFLEELRFDVCAREAYLNKDYIPNIERIDTIEDFVLIHSIIPASISSTPSHNDYSPKIYEKDSAPYRRVLQRMQQYSTLKNQAKPLKKSRK